MKLNFFFMTNDVFNEGKKCDISVVGGKSYVVQRGFMNNKPNEKNFDKLCQLIKKKNIVTLYPVKYTSIFSSIWETEKITKPSVNTSMGK